MYLKVCIVELVPGDTAEKKKNLTDVYVQYESDEALKIAPASAFQWLNIYMAMC